MAVGLTTWTGLFRVQTISNTYESKCFTLAGNLRIAWELLTDASLPEIAAMKSREPMAVKMELAGRIVGDFHSAAEAKQAGEDFDREVRQGGEPADIVRVHYGVVGEELEFPQMLYALGTAPSESRRSGWSKPVLWSSMAPAALISNGKPWPERTRTAWEEVEDNHCESVKITSMGAITSTA